MCGTTNLEDAQAAVKAGVDALGFIFFPKSPRNIEPEQAKQIISHLPPFVDCVGVFVNEDIEKVKKIIALTGLNHIQLHGNESVEYCLQLKTDKPEVRIMKAFRVDEDHLNNALFTSYENAIHGFLFDTYAKGQEGGTGETFNWDLLGQLMLTKPIILAGGLTPDNAAQAVKEVAPFAIDINSGVELSPGKKDHQALKQLIERVKAL